VNIALSVTCFVLCCGENQQIFLQRKKQKKKKAFKEVVRQKSQKETE
jgi:hypothetical protein